MNKVKRNKKIKINIFDILYFFFIAILPLIFNDNLANSYLTPRQIYLTAFLSLIGIIILISLNLKQLQASYSFLKYALPLSIYAFIIATILSFMQAAIISESIYTLSKHLILSLFFITTAYLLINDKIKIESIAKGIIVFIYITIIYAIYNVYNIYTYEEDFFRSVNRIYATFGNKNLLASALFLSLFFLVYAFSLSKIWRILSIVASILVIFLIWLIQTKAVIVALAVFFATFTMIVIFKRKVILSDKYKKFISISGIAVIIISLFIGLITFQNKDKFSHLFNRNSADARFLLWENTTEVIKDNFIFGVGAGNFPIHFPKYGLDKFPNQEVRDGIATLRNPHNDFLWVFSETGIIGLIAYSSIFIIAIYYLIILIKNSMQKKELFTNALLLSFITGYIFIALVDFPLERIVHQILLFIILATVLAKYYTYKEEKTEKIKQKHQKTYLLFVFLLFLIPISLSFIVTKNRYNAELHTKNIYSAQSRQNWDVLIREAELAKNYFYKYDYRIIPITWYKGVGLFSTGQYEKAKIEFKQARNYQPYSIRVINNLASTYGILGEYDKAAELYLKALDISPRYEEAILNLSAAYFNLKDYDNALNTIKKAPINSRQDNYKAYLNAILNAWTIELINNTENQEKADKINQVRTTDNELRRIFFEAHKSNSDFKELLISSL